MPEFTNNNLLLGGLVASAVGLLGISYIYIRRDRRKYVPVGVVSKLFIHPIKSCRGLEVTQAECVALGMKSNGVLDRSFLIMDANKDLISRIREPSLSLVAPSLSEDKQSLLVDAPGMSTLTIPIMSNQKGRVFNTRVLGLSVQGEDCGDEASEWISKYLDKPRCRLVCFSNKCADKILQNDRKWGSKARPGEKGVFQNLSHLHILSEASLQDLNSRIDENLTYENFRPNIVVSGVPAFSEDKWKYIRIGDEVLLRTTHKCARCPQTTVNHQIGKFMESKEPLKTLRLYRMAASDDPDKKTYGANPVFGTNNAVESYGHIKLGDPVLASLV